jgi:hypothetical protein
MDDSSLHTDGRSYIYFLHGPLSLNRTLAYLCNSTPKLFSLHPAEMGGFFTHCQIFLDFFYVSFLIIILYSLGLIAYRPPSPREIEHVDHVPRSVLYVLSSLRIFLCLSVKFVQNLQYLSPYF